MKSVEIKNRKIGDGYETIFLAELNSAFGQDLEEGKRMIKAAAEANCDFLKAEILRTTDIVLNDGAEYIYQYGFNGKTKTEKWYDIVKRKINPLEFYREMFEYSRSLGLEFIVSVYDIESVNFLSEISAAAIKIPSSNINHEPLIQVASESGIPLIFDTGKIYLSELARALDWSEKYGASGIIINHHPGIGPAPAKIHNLNIMQVYKKTFGVPVGLSCHYVGDEILYTSIGMGANVLEKPISFDPSKSDIDTCFAVSISDLKEIVRKIKCCWQAIGSGKRDYIPDRHIAQHMCIVAKKAIAAGSIINTENFRFAWPCKGISVEDWSKVKGKKLAASVNIDKGIPLKWIDVDFD